jgi:hypothetical protein
MSAAEKIQQEIQPDMVADRLAEAEGMLKNEKVKLPDEVLEAAVKGIKNISEKLEKRLPVYESDFDFMEELERFVKLGSEYKEAMENLKVGDLYNPEKPIEGDKKAPTMNEVLSALQTKLTKEQKEVIAQMKNPTLLIKPITEWRRFSKNLGNVMMEDDQKIKNEWTKNEKDTGITDKITGWEVGFAEGEQKLDGKEGVLGDLIKEWQNGHLVKKGAKLVTNNEYMLLMARSIKKGQRIDKKGHAVLRGENRENIIGGGKRVSFCKLFFLNPFFKFADPNNSFDNVIFRASVMMKI